MTVTERREGVWAQTVKLVGTDRARIFQEIKELFENPASYETMAQARNPYGDAICISTFRLSADTRAQMAIRLFCI